MSSFAEGIINRYVWEQFKLNGASNISGFSYSAYKNVMPIFPVSDNLTGDEKWSGKPYIIYDSFMKPRSKYKGFYPIKSAQMMYSIKSGKIQEVYEWRDFIFNVLDREDAAAFDINEYAGTVAALQPLTIKFNCINASQVNYIGNTTEVLGTKKTFSTNLVIKYDFHTSNIYNNA